LQVALSPGQFLYEGQLLFGLQFYLMGGGVDLSKELPKAESQALLHCRVGGASHGPFLVTFQDLLKDQGKLRGKSRGWFRHAPASTLECKGDSCGGGARRVIPKRGRTPSRRTVEVPAVAALRLLKTGSSKEASSS